MTTPRGAHPRGIWVTPGSDPEIEAAVIRAGGELVPRHRARGVIVEAGGPEAITDLTAGVEWIQLPLAGIERWENAGVIDPGRITTNAGPAYADTVAEHVVMLILAARRNMKTVLRARTWTSGTIRPLAGSTVFIVGAGRIGEAVVRRLLPFEVTVQASTRSGRRVEGAAVTVRGGQEHTWLRSADVVVITAPATDETHKLVDRRFLGSMQPTATLVNVARGTLVDTDAVVEALEAGTLGAVALDVTDPEPLPDGHPLWDHPRAIVTPHIANTPKTSIDALARLVEENVLRFLAGEPLLGVVDSELGY